MATPLTIRTLALGLVLVSGAADAGLFSKKKPAPPPPPEPAPVVVPVAPPPPPPPIPLEFSGIQTAAPLPAPLDRVRSASPEVLATLDWVQASKDNRGLPFILVDKVNAQVYAFTPEAQLKATAPILLGMGVGDVPLVSPDAPMSAIPPAKRITPAGRYPSRLVKDEKGKLVLLVDGPNLITLHIVAKGTPAQRRAERLASLGSDDNRVSFGCINVPPAFFTSIVSQDFQSRAGIVYVLPEKTTAAQLFGFQPAMPAPMAAPASMTAAVSSPLPGAPVSTTAAVSPAPVSGVSPTSALSLSLVPASPATTQAPAAVVAAQAEPLVGLGPVNAALHQARAAASESPGMPPQAPQAAPVVVGDGATTSAPSTQ